MSSKDLFSLGRFVAEEEDKLDLEAGPSEATRRKLAERAAGRRQERRIAVRSLALLIAAGLALIAVVAMAFSARIFPRNEALSFTVGDNARPGVLHVWEAAPSGGKLPIRFSDGSNLTLDPEARVQVTGVRANGAEVVIASGRAFVDVFPRSDGSWRLKSGPFEIAVKGTRFEVGWDPKADALELRLFEGRVLVTGCGLGKGRSVERGQQVRASCRAQEFAISALAPAPLARREAETTEPAERAGISAQIPPVPAPSAAAAGAESWQSLARNGYFQRAYDLASKGGFELECGRASAVDGVLLGDAARLSGRNDHARLAYTSVRRRFPSSDASARAAFALGRLAFQANDLGGAADWFQTYLDEQPSGSLAPAALDRLLEASLRIGNAARTRSIAAVYLARYPAGPHAKDARRILDGAKSLEQP